MRPALVTLFLRGGADGLALVPPHGEGRLYELRPTLAQRENIIDLDGHFGLHPGASALARWFTEGSLAIIHGIGSDDTTRSHFEAQDRVEYAGETAGSAASGWLARHLSTRQGGALSPLAAISFGSTLSASLRGVGATVLENISELALGADEDGIAAIEQLYGQSDGLPLGRELGRAGLEAVSAARSIARLEQRSSPLERGYPNTTLARQLADAATLLRHREELGVEVITVDHGGWDSHFVQEKALASLTVDLGGSLDAFLSEVFAQDDEVAVLVLSEFGRRAYENVSLGTDHGRGTVAFVASRRLARRGVLGVWPGLEDLEPPGDLRVTTDFRQLLLEASGTFLRNQRASEVFPGFEPTALGLFR